MKNVFFVMAVLLGMATYAQENPDLEKAVTLIKLTGATSSFDVAIDQIGQAVPAAKKGAYTEEARSTLEGVYKEMGAMYLEEFTPTEIDALVQFYNSELGKKLASKQTLMIQKGMAIGQNWGFKVGQIAQKYSQN